jgi:hypothetical protein
VSSSATCLHCNTGEKSDVQKSSLSRLAKLYTANGARLFQCTDTVLSQYFILVICRATLSPPYHALSPSRFLFIGTSNGKAKEDWAGKLREPTDDHGDEAHFCPWSSRILSPYFPSQPTFVVVGRRYSLPPPQTKAKLEILHPRILNPRTTFTSPEHHLF